MKYQLRPSIIVPAALAVFLGTAAATPVTFYDQDPNPGGTVPLDGKAEAEKVRFINTLIDQVFTTEDMNSVVMSIDPDTDIGSGSFFGGLIDVTTEGDPAGAYVQTSGGRGRFNTSPDTFGQCGSACPWFEAYDSFTLTSNDPDGINAIGFFGTDFSDFRGSLTLELTSLDGSRVERIAVPTAATGSNSDGSLIFWGFTDSQYSYRSITFNIRQGEAGVDVFGIDDVILGRVVTDPVVIPEPSSLALVGLSLAGLAAFTRRKSRA